MRLTFKQESESIGKDDCSSSITHVWPQHQEQILLSLTGHLKAEKTYRQFSDQQLFFHHISLSGWKLEATQRNISCGCSSRSRNLNAEWIHVLILPHYSKCRINDQQKQNLLISVPLGRQRQEDCTEISRLAWSTQQIPSQPGSQSSVLPQRTKLVICYWWLQTAWPVVDDHKPRNLQSCSWSLF